MGNLDDELHKERYEGQAAENTETQEPEEQVPEEPQGVTLDEYYRAKGIEIESLDAGKR